MNRDDRERWIKACVYSVFFFILVAFALLLHEPPRRGGSCTVGRGGPWGRWEPAPNGGLICVVR